ncbi:hypothetical protein AB1Y20_003788 [Prymnesium parvum]|uniref:Class I SAM-dependent methyltransferase n=1 Tax=Prymnesium parvum TaxID=97485 RepID=A0AB34J7M6_PRYPA
MLLVTACLAEALVTHVDDVLSTHGLPLANSHNATIAMDSAESSTFLSLLLRPSTRTYLEWGSGGSTELVSHLILSGVLPQHFRAFSIESSTTWIALMRERSHLIRKAEATKRLVFVHGSMGPTGHLGYPKNFVPDNGERAYGYVGLSNKIGQRKLDLVLVDGRFRLACALEAYKHLREGSEALVMLHDYKVMPPGFTQKRFDTYSKARRFYHLVQRNESLAVFSPRKTVASADLDSLLQRALLLPD